VARLRNGLTREEISQKDQEDQEGFGVNHGTPNPSLPFLIFLIFL
jgi:hypothetical protein